VSYVSILKEFIKCDIFTYYEYIIFFLL